MAVEDRTIHRPHGEMRTHSTMTLVPSSSLVNSNASTARQQWLLRGFVLQFQCPAWHSAPQLHIIRQKSHIRMMASI
jgi:hypothetical protein